MKVAGDHVFDASPEDVWNGLMDPEVLAATMPGCDKLELVGENEYRGILNIRVGPVQGKFEGKITLEDIAPPNAYTMLVDGRGAPGFVNATAKVSIAPDGDATRLTYDGDAAIGGRIAGVGQRLLDSSAKSIIRQSLEGLNQTLKARSAAGGDPAAAVAATAPTQGEFAREVAKDVAKDLIPRPVLITLIIAVLLLILFFVFR